MLGKSLLWIYLLLTVSFLLAAVLNERPANVGLWTSIVDSWSSTYRPFKKRTSAIPLKWLPFVMSAWSALHRLVEILLSTDWKMQWRRHGVNVPRLIFSPFSFAITAVLFAAFSNMASFEATVAAGLVMGAVAFAQAGVLDALLYTQGSAKRANTIHFWIVYTPIVLLALHHWISVIAMQTANTPQSYPLIVAISFTPQVVMVCVMPLVDSVREKGDATATEFVYAIWEVMTLLGLGMFIFLCTIPFS